MQRGICFFIINILILALSTSLLSATTNQNDELQSNIKKTLSNSAEYYRGVYEWPTLAISYSTENVFANATANDSNNHTDNEAIYGIGSCTKSMAATLLAKEIEKGTLHWKMNLEEVFQVINQNAKKPLHLAEEFKEVRLESILTHTGYIADPYPVLDENMNKSIEHYLENGIPSEPAHNSPEFKYSSIGYSIVAYISERLNHKRWDYLIKENLFEPLGMQNCLVQPKVFENPPDHFLKLEKLIAPSFYEGALEDLHGANHLEKANLAGGAAVFCSLRDWNKYMRFLINGHNGETPEHKKLIWKKETFEHLFLTNHPHNYTFGGWQSGDGLHYHNGSNGAYISQGRLNLKTREVVLTVTNTSLAGDFGSLHWIGDQVLEAVHALHPVED